MCYYNHPLFMFILSPTDVKTTVNTGDFLTGAQVQQCGSQSVSRDFFYLQFSHPERSKRMWKRRKSFSAMTELGISSWQTDNKSTFNILIVWFWQLSCQSRGLENQFLLLYFSLRWGRDCEAVLYKAFSIQRPLNCRWYKKKKTKLKKSI